MSDFYKLTITILRKTISKVNAKKIFYRDYKAFDHNTFEETLKKETLIKNNVGNYYRLLAPSVYISGNLK